MITTVSPTAGLAIAPNRRCLKCGSAMFIKPAPCFMRKHGWGTCVKCVKCGNTEGLSMARLPGHVRVRRA